MSASRAGRLSLSLLFLLSAVPATTWSSAKPRTVDVNHLRRIGFGESWLFHRDAADGAERPGYADASWRTLDLPHDWAIEGPFDRRYNPHAGGLPYFGVGWYRKHFSLPAGVKGQCVSLEFDGAMANSRVWLNGQELGGRPYGYIGFAVDLTPHLLWDGRENVLAVRLSPEEQSSRWYPGAGIYRNVWLEITAPLHVARWGTYVTTSSVSDEKAQVAVKTRVENRGDAAVRVTIETVILDASDKAVARADSVETIPAKGVSVLDARLDLAQPQRWDVGRPYLYRVVSSLRDGTRVLDRYVTPFGVRTIEFDKAQGFLLNGRKLKLQGVCMHHDLGALGTAVNRRATERQLEILKGMGVNALRTSHNPPSPELLDLCDRLGVLVMDEAFDMWSKPKVPNGHGKYFAEWGETDLRDMIRRDRNHPSIVLWSIGNEILEQGDADGWKLARRLTDICHEEDPTRPVTAGFNHSTEAIKNGLAAQVDIPGFNYKPLEYERILRDHPDWVIVGAETSSCVSSRGVYHLPIEKYKKHESLQLTSYDVIAPEWAYAPDVELLAQERSPQVLGEFVWTGFDYLGEPTPYFGWKEPMDERDWPARSSYFGAIDLAGFPKDRYYLYKSVWTRAPMVHILPHWNWAGREGQLIPVVAYTNADEVELFLNERSLGRRQRAASPMEIPVGPNVSADLRFSSKYRLLWQVPYESGALRAVALKDGVPVATEERRTAGAPARIRLVPDRTSIHADGEDLSFITVRIEDKDGNLHPTADNLVRFAVEGAGRVAAVDNGNAATTEPFQASRRKAFNGLCLLIVRSARGAGGAIRVSATSDGLDLAQTTVVATPD
jgi:beta-galactosidase